VLGYCAHGQPHAPRHSHPPGRCCWLD
jgi:hypothetical protein